MGAGGDLPRHVDQLVAADIVTIDIDVKRTPDVVTDLAKMGIASEKFDIVCCLEVLEHVPEPQTAIAELKRVLKTEGILYISTPFICGIHDAPNDFYRYTKYGLSYLLRDFDILHLEGRDGPLTTFLIMGSRLFFSKKFTNKVIGAIFCLAGPVLKPLLRAIDKLLDDKITYGYSVIARKRINKQ